MLVRACGWHKHFFGYPKLLGFKRERRLRIAVSHGMCDGCSALWRAGARGRLPWWSELKRFAVVAFCIAAYLALAFLAPVREPILRWLYP